MDESTAVRSFAVRSFKERQYQKREELILQIAEEMLFARGYYEVSMDDIAARVGIARGTLYRHFASKEDLVFTFIKRDLSVLLHDFEGIVATHNTVQEKLEAVLLMIYQKVSGRYVSFLDSGTVPCFTAEKIASIHEIKDALLEHIRYLLEAGKASGEFDRTLPSDVSASALLALASPFISKRLVTEGNRTKEELEKELIHISRKIVAPPS
ncbi:MAG TPA: TetR/AcrR family transcriptional regulator [Ktedonobacteraceae bacterium]|jgi:AcrR family transcriptional regulator